MTFNLFQVTLPGPFTVNPLPGFGSTVPLKNLGDFVGGLLNIGFLIAGFLLLFWLTWGIYAYLIAGGNKEHLANAQNRIKWALVGFGIVVIAFLVSQFVQGIFFTTTTITPPGGVKNLIP